MKLFVVSKDSIVQFTGTSNECFAYVLKHQPMSVYWATTYEGWDVKPATEKEMELCGISFG